MALGEFTGLFEHVADAVVAYHPETGEILAANDACRELVGYRKTELRGADVSLLGPADQGSSALTDGRNVARARSERGIRIEWGVETSGGEQIPVDVNLTTTTRDGQAVALASIRERHRPLYENGQVFLWEFDLSEAVRYAESIAEDVDDLVAYLDDNPDEHGRILDGMRALDANERAVEFYEADSKEQLIANVEAVMTEESVAKMRRVWQTIVEGGTSCRVQCTARTLEGNRRDLVFELVVPETPEGYSRVYMIGLDITERRDRERELAAAHDARRALQESLADSTSAGAFADAACAELTAVDAISHARVATLSPAGSIDTLAEAGEPESAVGAGAAIDGDRSPAIAAAREGEPRRVRLPDDSDLAEGATPGEPEVVAVPIDHGCVTRGALVVHLAGERVLGEDEIRNLLNETADVVGYALGSAARRRALAAGDRVELTAVIDAEEVPLVDALRSAGASAAVTAAIPRGEDSTLCYLAVERGDPGEVVAAARGTGGIGHAERVDTADEARIQLVTSGRVPNTVLAESGGDVVDARVNDGRVTVTARFPLGTPFDPLLDALADQFGEVVTTEYTSEPSDVTPVESHLAELTGRQREVLEAAFRAGYFERPRTQDASTVADRLGVSRQAYQQVLRAAQRNLLSGVFEDD